ncbi:MAG: hypothetical protein JW795_06685 [Chitinivibrionales bacterium]|nr:hypothetical protein [Chitinivibrionales bacterium]
MGNRVQRTLLIMIFLGGTAVGSPIQPMKFMPVDDDIAGWINDPYNKCSFLGEANDNQQLLDLFDGPGQPFIDRGFKRGAFKGLISIKGSDTNYICLEIFDMGIVDSSKSMYKFLNMGTTAYEFINNLGDSARLSLLSLYSYDLEICYKHYIIRLFLYYNQKTESMKQTVKDFGAVIVKKINKAIPIIVPIPSIGNIKTQLSMRKSQGGIVFEYRASKESLKKTVPLFMYDSKGILVRSLELNASVQKKVYSAFFDNKNFSLPQGNFTAVINDDGKIVRQQIIFLKDH